jgi:hypothetical protein
MVDSGSKSENLSRGWLPRRGLEAVNSANMSYSDRKHRSVPGKTRRRRSCYPFLGEGMIERTRSEGRPPRGISGSDLERSPISKNVCANAAFTHVANELHSEFLCINVLPQGIMTAGNGSEWFRCGVAQGSLGEPLFSSFRSNESRRRSFVFRKKRSSRPMAIAARSAGREFAGLQPSSRYNRASPKTFERRGCARKGTGGRWRR